MIYQTLISPCTFIFVLCSYFPLASLLPNITLLVRSYYFATSGVLPILAVSRHVVDTRMNGAQSHAVVVILYDNFYQLPT
jgi:hypothetical protein